jgi:hypothetical protein
VLGVAVAALVIGEYQDVVRGELERHPAALLAVRPEYGGRGGV